MSVIAFHEKAGRSQVGSFVFSSDKVFPPRVATTVATLPSAKIENLRVVWRDERMSESRRSRLFPLSSIHLTPGFVRLVKRSATISTSSGRMGAAALTRRVNWGCSPSRRSS
jgi:hypothetical protein